MAADPTIFHFANRRREKLISICRHFFLDFFPVKSWHFLHLAALVGRADSIYGPEERAGSFRFDMGMAPYPLSTAAFLGQQLRTGENHSGCVIFLFDRSRWRLGSGNVTRRPAPPLNERLLVYVRIYLICIPWDRSSSALSHVIHLSGLLNLKLNLSNKLLTIHRWRQSACLMNGTEWRTTTDLLIRLLNFFCVRCSTSCRCCYLAGWMRLLTAHQRAEEQKKKKKGNIGSLCCWWFRRMTEPLLAVSYPPLWC